MAISAAPGAPLDTLPKRYMEAGASLATDRCFLFTLQDFSGADVRFGDVSSKDSLRKIAFSEPADVVVSCLASRTGGKVTRKHQQPVVLFSLLTDPCQLQQPTPNSRAEQ